MYGTVARTRVRPENRDALRTVLAAQAYDQVEGFRHSYVLWEDGTDVMWLVAVFADRESYERNASDPAQHARYLEYRALMEEEPAWHDGPIESL
jgi:quinol monooxygenase YgiN